MVVFFLLPMQGGGKQEFLDGDFGVSVPDQVVQLPDVHD